MAAPIAFESAWVKKEERKQIREARQDYLDKAKEKYEREEQRREAARQRGENTWMLDSVSQRIQQQQQVSDKAKSKKHKKEKKRKKLKKEKKKGKRTKSSDSESVSSTGTHIKRKLTKSSDSESETEEEAVWVEQGAQDKTEKSSTKGPQLQRDSWMESPLDLIPTVTRDDLRRSRKEQEQQEKPAVSLIDQPGQHPRELNPFWKDGGTGLPEDRSAASSSKGGNSRAGDRGVSWLRKAYQRCQQQAAEEKRPLAEVAEERWGSLEKLENMLAEAERKGEEQPRGRGQTHGRDQTQGRSPFMRPRSRSRDSEKSNHRDRDRSRSRERNRSRSKERHRHWRRSGSTERSQPRSRSKDRHSRSPDQRSKRGRFLKPGESGEKSSYHHADRRPDTRPSWRKEGFEKPSEKSPRDSPSLEEKPPAKGKRQGSHDTRGGDSTSDSSSDSSVSEDEAPPPGETAPPTEPLLTEQQLNELGAKILRAEIMGDEELASSLKHKLSVAQKALEDRKNNPVPVNPEGEENVVVLTRVDKRGMVRPLADRKHPVEPKGGRRKAGKAQTHSDEGRRQKYFDDDDKFDLKTLVEREKMGTAEDQNGMFARLAGRAAEKTDDDFQVDDLFIKNAMRKQNESRLEDRDRMLAITDHKKMTAALDKCQFCFDKVPKHLIIAIGAKSYLCLPNHRSLAEGHCQIVPMQHVSCATALDEDVWSEIQTFRKSLTRMFASNEEDCVFMESAMFLRSQPHMLVECVPLPRELGDMAPIYFKKAILDSETEWAQNKKVVDLSQKDVRRAVPKGFPYFSVDFGLQGGFAHVIEDEKKFTTYFGKEVLGGMLDAEPRLWRKPWRENFEDQRKKVLQFADVWKPFDWTQTLDK